MATAAPSPIAPPGPTRAAARVDVLTRLGPGETVYLHPVAWDEYQFLTAACEAAGRRLRTTYDRGRLEFMTKSYRHEVWGAVLTGLIACAAEETGRSLVGAGSMSVARQDLDRGFEPDACFYIQNAAKMLPLRNLDFTHDPPPDLAVEIEVSRTIIARLPIYATFRVPEVWRYDGTALTVLHLGPAGAYAPAAASLAFPALSPADVARFLALAVTLDQATVTRQFRDWVRATVTGPTI